MECEMKQLSIFAIAFLVAAPAAAQPGPGSRETAGAERRTEQKTERRTEQGAERTRQGLSNAGLTGKVKSALAADVGLKTLTAIDVDSDAGIVTLKGKVDSADAKRRAEQVAKRVEGVSSVKNRLSVEAKK
jgi:osmotically-inducible protein OsmY